MLEGKNVLITGASRGIGAATARIFAQAGANVGLFARDADALLEVTTEIGAHALSLPGDVSSYQSIKSACDVMKERFGPVDILINNAGIIDPIGQLHTIDPEDWKRVVDVNLTAVFYGIHAVLPDMLNKGQGTILTIGSGAASHALEGWSHYCASKAGVHHLNSCLDAEYRDKGIRAIILSPGTVATNMQHQIKRSGMNPVSKLEFSDHIPPEWPALALRWMATADANAHLGKVVSLRDPAIRHRIGIKA